MFHFNWPSSSLSEMPPPRKQKKVSFMMNEHTNISALTRKLRSKRKQIRFLQKLNFLPTSVTCGKCSAPLSKILWELRAWQCTKCSTKKGLLADTCLSNTKVSLRRVIMMGSYFYILLCLFDPKCPTKMNFDRVSPINHWHNQVLT